jgi:hypothetical protein
MLEYRFRLKHEGDWGVKLDIHCFIHLVDGQIAMDVFHCFSSCLHGIQCFLIDIRSFDAIYLSFDLVYLVTCLL